MKNNVTGIKGEISKAPLVGIMADSHDNRVMIKKAVDFFNERSVDLTLHAGDYIAPFKFE